MINKIFENAKAGIEVRQNLSLLRKEINDDIKMDRMFEIAEDNMETICGFLESEDAKTRKNAALLMGDLDMSDFAEPLFKAYCKETQLFVKTAYLTALKNYDITEYLTYFKDRLSELENAEVTEENKKHISEEIKCLTDLIVGKEGIKGHEFNEFKDFSRAIECILITNKLHKNIVESQLTNKDCEIIPFKGGVRIKTNNIKPVLKLRTYSELLFVIPGYKICEGEPVKVANAIFKSGLLDMIKYSHDGNAPYYFRTELKSKLPLDKKSQFTKRFSAELERLTKRQLINSTSNYEFEIRLIENKEGRLNALLKMNTIKDNRFAYYKRHISASIKPVNAALFAQLTEKYMKADATILDPFCGVGTMLIEREKCVRAGSVYGIDINADAIEGARINAEAAKHTNYYINRNFFQFTHEYLFDEIFTDMPFDNIHKNSEEIKEIYRNFFRKAKEVLKEDGVIIMFTRNSSFAEVFAGLNGYDKLEDITMSEKEDAKLMVFKLYKN